jgi:probable HAF family extracellular repeat protein
MFRGLAFCIWAASAGWSVPSLCPAQPRSCRATDLGTLGGRSSRGAAINAGGVVAGSSDDLERPRAAVIAGSGWMPLGDLSGFARDIDGIGRVVGSADVGPEETHAFLWDGSSVHDLGALGGARDATATAINERGEIVGFSQIGPSDASPYHAFLIRDGQMLDLGAPGGSHSVANDINNGGEIAGFYSRADGGGVAFILRDGAFTDLGHLGGSDAEANAINDAGEVAGVSATANAERHAFRLAGGVLEDLGTFGGARSLGLGINGAGDVVGAAETAGGALHAFVAPRGGGAIDLHAVAAPAGVTLYEAVDIADGGAIVANGRLPDGSDHAFLLRDCP